MSLCHLTAPDPIELIRDGRDMPVWQIWLSRVERHQAAAEKRIEVVPQDQIVKGLFHLTHGFALAFSDSSQRTQRGFPAPPESYRSHAPGLLPACHRRCRRKAADLVSPLRLAWAKPRQNAFAHGHLARCAARANLDLSIKYFANEGRGVLRALSAGLSDCRNDPAGTDVAVEASRSQSNSRCPHRIASPRSEHG